MCMLSNEPALHIRWPNTGASAAASVLPMNIQGWNMYERAKKYYQVLEWR